MPMEVFECRETDVSWSSRKLGLNKLGSDIFPSLSVTTLRKNRFSTVLRHVEHWCLVFWKADKLFLLNTCNNWGFGSVPTIWSTLTIGADFGQNGFLALPNFKCPFLKSWEDRYQKFGRTLFGTHASVYISKLSFTEIPKTVIGGDIFRKVGISLPHWTNDNFGPSCNPIKLKLGRLRDLIHNFDLSFLPSQLNKFPKFFCSLNCGFVWKTAVTLQQNALKSVLFIRLTWNFYHRLNTTRAWCGSSLSSIGSLFVEKSDFENWKKKHISFFKFKIMTAYFFTSWIF